ncbi:MAG: hypothetical protein ACR2NU_05305 [Aeoliella sp.]
MFATLAAATSPASITVEIVTEPGVQATAPREWLQLLTTIGQRNVSIRTKRSGDSPQLSQSGSDERPRYRVVGLLNGRNELLLPGGRFSLRSRSKLADYFDRLAADGPEGVTAEKGRFGLTEKQFAAVHADLAQPLALATNDQSLVEVLKELRELLELELTADDEAWEILKKADPVTDDVEQLTVGTALALLLRSHDLVLLPEKQRGKEVTLRIARKQEEARDEKTEVEVWPVGWESEESPSKLAPALMETLNAEIDGFTLAEAMGSIAPRIGVPIFWDHATLREREIDPTTIEVKFARKRTHLKRVVDKLLFQARLKGELRIDEAGTVFYWISR